MDFTLVSEDTSQLLDKILASEELFNDDGVTLEYFVIWLNIKNYFSNLQF